MESLRRIAGKVDDVVYQVERVLLLVSLTLMTVLVSLDVAQRTFSRPVSKTEQFILWAFYANPTDAQHAFVTDRLGPALFAFLSLLFLTLGTHSSRAIKADRDKAPSPGFGRSVVIGAALFLGLTGFVYGLLWVFPSSVPGAQKLALGLMLWSGMLGASLATRARRHIVLDPIKKKLDPQTLKGFSLVGGLVTFAFCAFMTVLGVMQLRNQIEEWSGGGGVGVFDAVPIPLWVSTLAIPVTFGVMGLRFLGQGIHDFVWGPPKGGVDAHGIDLEALEKEQLPLEGDAP